MALKCSEILANAIVIDTTKSLERSVFWIWGSGMQLSSMSFAERQHDIGSVVQLKDKQSTDREDESLKRSSSGEWGR